MKALTGYGRVVIAAAIGAAWLVGAAANADVSELVKECDS
jgi:hypothetical protein